MPDGIQIRIEGLEQVLAHLSPARFQASVSRGVAAAALEVKGWIAWYPPQRHGPAIWRNDAERAAFFAALRAGKIEVPYRRGLSPGSETLGRRWTVEKRNNGLTMVIGNNANYAAKVHSALEQHPYHTITGWRTDEQAIKEKQGRVNEIINTFIAREVRGGF